MFFVNSNICFLDSNFATQNFCCCLYIRTFERKNTLLCFHNWSNSFWVDGHCQGSRGRRLEMTLLQPACHGVPLCARWQHGHGAQSGLAGKGWRWSCLWSVAHEWFVTQSRELLCSGPGMLTTGHSQLREVILPFILECWLPMCSETPRVSRLLLLPTFPLPGCDHRCHVLFRHSWLWRRVSLLLKLHALLVP